MTVRIPLEFGSSGTGKTVQEILAIRDAIKRTSNERSGFIQLSEALGTTYKEAKQVAKELGASGALITQAADALKRLDAAGANATTKLNVLQQRFGLSAKQAEKFSATIEQYQKSAAESTEQTSAFGGGVAELAFKFNNVIQAIGALVAAAKPAYDFLIGSNERLNAQILKSQTNLASATRLSQGGQEITDPTAKIQATRSQIESALRQIEKDTENLVGVTSEQVNSFFDATLTNATQLIGQSKQFADPIQSATALTKGFAAAFKVAGLSADQVSSEIRSILTGQELENSTIAKSLQLSKTQIDQFKQQGTLVDQLNQRLETFVAGNAIAAKTIEGAGSNIVDFLQRLGRVAGEPLLQPITDALTDLFAFLKKNEAAIFAFFKGFVEGGVATARQVSATLKPALEGLLEFVQKGAPLVQNLFTLFSTGVITTADAIANSPILQLLGQIIITATDGLSKLSELVLLRQINDGVDALEALNQQSQRLTDETSKTVLTLKQLNDQRSKGIPLTEEQQLQEKALQQNAKNLVPAIDGMIESYKQLKAIAPETAKGREAEIANLEKLKESLQGANGALTIQGKEAQNLGDSYTQLKNKTEAAQRIINAGLETPELQQAFKDRLETTQELVELGKITSQEAARRLEEIQNNAKADVDTQLKAKQDAVKIKKDQVDAEIALIQAGQAEIEASQAAGRIGEAEADKELTDSKAEEIQKRIEANKAALETASGPEREKLLAEERKLQSELEKVREEFRKRENKRRLEDFDEQRKVLEGQFARGATDRATYNQQLTQIDQQQSAEELRQLGEDLQRLESTDKEGREAINAKIGEAYKKRSELAKQAFDREVKLLDDALAKSNDLIKLAETEFQTDVQALQNIGAISTEEADKRRLDSTLNRISKEFDAEQEKYDALAALPSLDDPLAQEEQQKVLRAQQQKLADLRLQNLQVIEQREQKLRDIAIKGIQQQTALEKARIDSTIGLLAKRKSVEDAVARSIDRQGKLQQSSANLQKALSGSREGAISSELSGIEKAIELRRQLEQETDPIKKRALREALSKLGINQSTTELELVRQKQDAENRLAQQKRAALLAEQARTRLSLDLDLKREASAARRAVTEAKIAEDKARQAVIEARASLSQANLIKDPKEREIAISNAQNQLNEATQGISEATATRKDAEQSLEDQKSIAAESRETLAIQQQTELSAFNTAENFRQIDQALELANAKAAEFQQSLQGAANAARSFGGLGAPTPRRSGGPVEAGQPYLVGEEGPELILPSRNGFVMTANQTAAMLGGVAMPALQAGQAVMSNRIGGMGGAQDAALLEEVQNLNQSLKEVAEQAAYPRTVVIPSEAPISSAAQIWSDISKYRVRRSGK
jgi:hypothetical protein